MLMALLQLLAGFALAALGGEVFVRGCISTAGLLRIPGAIVAVTIAAFATSSPELSVAVNAALAGTPQIAVGNTFGGNIVNTALVLGLVLGLGKIAATRRDIGRDWLLAFIAPLLIILMARDGVIDRFDGTILLALFVVWLALLVRAALRFRQSTAASDAPKASMREALICIPVGLALLIGAGSFIVEGAEAIGTSFGLSPFVIGVTLIAIGTSMPELATTLIARLKGHGDIGLGTVIGSSIFNLMFIVGVTAQIHPIQLDVNEMWLATGMGLLALLFILPNSSGYLPRWRSLPLLGIYTAYVLVELLF